MEQHLRGTPDGHMDRTADHPDRDPGDRAGTPPALTEPERLPYDAGGWLRPGTIVIPADTMRPAPELTPEQIAAYNRLFGLIRDPEES